MTPTAVCVQQDLDRQDWVYSTEYGLCDVNSSPTVTYKRLNLRSGYQSSDSRCLFCVALLGVSHGPALYA